MRKVFLGVIVLLLFTFLPKPVLAEGEFSSSYNITYDVLDTGVTEVFERITLKNLTDKFYASSFSLTIGATDISDVSASDDQGALEVTYNKTGKKTEINVKFKQQVAGKGKEYPWVLRFKSKDFAQRQGKIWQVSVPKISSETELDNYNLTLSIPITFGDPTSILPEPQGQSETGNKLNYFFTKNQLLDSGILANFGTDQVFDFKLKYELFNNSILPAIAKVVLPSDKAYQEVILKKIDPKPENVTIDDDGNYIGWFKLSRKSALEVNVEGLTKLYINRQGEAVKLTKEQEVIYTSNQKYWDKDNQQIKTKLSEIFKDKNPKTNKEKALLIHKFVVNTLIYSEDRLTQNDFGRLGSLTALSNPNLALCSEFADLFITLARAQGIPARMLTGYAYTANTDLRPLSLDADVLHAWAEYYDPQNGWVMVDPTWENTTGGVDYFTKFDLNHFVLATRGVSSDEPSPASGVDVKFSEAQFIPSSNLKIEINAPKDVFALFPSTAKVKLINEGGSIIKSSPFSLSSAKINISSENNFYTPDIPPFGSLEYDFNLRTSSVWDSYEDILQARFEDQSVESVIKVKPFFAYKYFPAIVIGFVTLVTGIYIAIFVIHLKKGRYLLSKMTR